MKKVTLIGFVAWLAYFLLGTVSLPATAATALLSDDFNGNSLDTTKWSKGGLFSGTTDSTMGVFDTNQQLQIGPLFPNTSGSHYNGIVSLNTFDLTGSYASVQLVQAPSSSTAADAMFTIGRDVNNFYRIYEEAGSLVIQKKTNGNKAVLLSIAFDTVNHSFWRIRHDSTAGNVVFEAAPNSGGTPGTWTQLYSEAWNTAAIPVAAVLVELKGGTWQTESTNPGTVIFDNFNMGSGVVILPPAPPASTSETVLLADDFATTSLDTTKWATASLFSGLTDATILAMNAGQQLQIGPLYQNTSGSHYDGITSRSSYDFTGAYVYVQLVKAGPAGTNADSMLTIGNSGSNYYRIYVSGGNLVALKMINGTKTTLSSTAYNAVNHNFLRIRHDAQGSNVVFETAPNSGGAPGTWSQIYSEPWNANVILTNMRFEVKAGTWQSEVNAPGTIVFDNFRSAKPASATPPPIQKPQVSVSASTLSGNAALSVNFSANASSANGSIVSYSWNFGDGHTSTSQSPSNIYQSAGQYTAEVDVIDNAGAIASATVTISVTNPPPPPPTGTTTLKWLTWNVDFWEGTDEVYSMDRVATYIAKYSPDVIALCEFEIQSSSGANQAQQLISLLQQKSGITYSYYFVPKFPGCNEGNLILSRYAILSTDFRYLSANRSVAEATVSVNGRTFHLFATHLDDQASSNRIIEVSQLVSYMSGFSGNNIISGDFNASPDQTEIQNMAAFANEAWAKGLAAGTASAYPDNPVGVMTRTRRGQLDHIFWTPSSPNLSLQSVQIPDVRDLSHPAIELIGTSDDVGVRPSDHNLEIAIFKVN